MIRNELIEKLKGDRVKESVIMGKVKPIVVQ